MPIARRAMRPSTVQHCSNRERAMEYRLSPACPEQRATIRHICTGAGWRKQHVARLHPAASSQTPHDRTTQNLRLQFDTTPDRITAVVVSAV